MKNEKESSIEFATSQGVEWDAHKILREFKVVVADVEILLSHVRLWLDDAALGLHTPARGEPVAASADDGDRGRSFAEVKKVKQFMRMLNRDDVPIGSGALLCCYLDRNPDALNPAASMDSKFLWQKFSGSPAQSCGQRRSSSRTERRGDS